MPPDTNVTFTPKSEAFWARQFPPLGQEWEAELWAQIEQWKQEQRGRAQPQGELRRVG